VADFVWLSLQVRNFLMVAEDMGLAPEYVMRDNDAKFSAQFDEVLKSSGAIVKRNPPAVTEPAGPCGTAYPDTEV